MWYQWTIPAVRRTSMVLVRARQGVRRARLRSSPRRTLAAELTWRCNGDVPGRFHSDPRRPGMTLPSPGTPRPGQPGEPDPSPSQNPDLSPPVAGEPDSPVGVGPDTTMSMDLASID